MSEIVDVSRSGCRIVNAILILVNTFMDVDGVEIFAGGGQR